MKLHAAPLALGIAAVALFSTACSPKAKKAELPAAPDAAMRVVADELAAGNAQVLWTATPASYQADITALVREAGTKLDPEVYDRGFAIVGKIATVLDKQRAFILSSPMAGQFDKAKAEAGWDSAVGLFRALAESKLASVDGLKTFDPEAFLAKSGKELLGHLSKMGELSGGKSLSAELAAAKFTVEQVTDTSATLRMQPGDGSPSAPMNLTKVEGRWVPADLAAKWAPQIAEAKAKLAAYTPEDAAKAKPQALGLITMIEGVLGQMEAAKTQQEFDQAMQGAMMPIMGLMMVGQGAMGGLPAPAK